MVNYSLFNKKNTYLNTTFFHLKYLSSEERVWTQLPCKNMLSEEDSVCASEQYESLYAVHMFRTDIVVIMARRQLDVGTVSYF